MGLKEAVLFVALMMSLPVTVITTCYVAEGVTKLYRRFF